MLSEGGQAKIADFGIAKATGKAQTGSFLTATGTTVGTPNYMAPEQAMGQDVGPWTDLYSVGVMAFEFFVGHVPFHDTEEPMAVLMRQVSDPIPPARSLNPEVDEGISSWIEGMLEKDPAQRTRSASDAWDAFEEIVIGLVGPRWRRTARVLEPSRRPPDTPAGPYTPPPSAAARPPLMPTLGVPDRPPAEPRTRRLRDRERTGSARTVMPDAPTRRLEDRGPEPGAGPGGGAARSSSRPRWCPSPCSSLSRPRSEDAGPAPPARRESRRRSPTVTGRDLALRVPSGWSRLRRAPDLGLPLARASAAAPQGDPAGPLVEFGMAQGGAAANSTLLPQSFLSAIGNGGGAAPARTAVLLPVQGLQAWRYRGLRPVGTPGELTVYAVPTSGGVATLACSAPAAQAEAFARQCEAIAGTLQLRRGTPYPIGPSDAYASALNSTIGELQQTSSSQEASLQAAVTLDGQATAAQALARAYETAAAQLAALDLSPADRNANGRLVTVAPRRGERLPGGGTGGDRRRRRRVSRGQRRDTRREGRGECRIGGSARRGL